MNARPKSSPAQTRQELDALIAKIKAKVSHSPEKAALLLKDWSQRPAPGAATPSSNQKTTVRKKAG